MANLYLLRSILEIPSFSFPLIIIIRPGLSGRPIYLGQSGISRRCGCRYFQPVFWSVSNGPGLSGQSP